MLQFEKATHTGTEGMNISVCFILQNPPPFSVGFEFQFNITVTSSDESAKGLWEGEGEGEGKGRERRKNTFIITLPTVPWPSWRRLCGC